MGENMRRSEIVDEHRGVAEATLRRDADEAIRLLAQNMRVTTGYLRRGAAQGRARSTGDRRSVDDDCTRTWTRALNAGEGTNMTAN